eukprot:jgi/Galph1/2571/GphlegSOOS_G1250.1
MGLVTISRSLHASYDYGATMNEGRQLTDRYSEQKSVVQPTSPTLYLQGRVNKEDGTQLYILRHRDGTSITKETTRILIQGVGDDYEILQEPGTYILIDRRDSKMLPCYYRFENQYLIYSTAEMMTHTTVTVLIGTLMWLSFTWVFEGKLDKTHWDQERKHLRINYQQNEATLFDPCQSKVSGPYLLRTAKYGSDGGLHLRGDTEIETTLRVIPPKVPTYITWNGEELTNLVYEEPLTWKTSIPGPPPVYLSSLDFWKLKYEKYEKEPSFNDSDWVIADKNHTNSPFKPTTLPVLYMDDYGFHGKADTSVCILCDSMDTSWELHGKNMLNKEADNVIAILLENMSHDEDYTNTHNKWQHPRGLVQVKLATSCTCHEMDDHIPIHWTIQGNLRGEEYIDSVRGLFNNGGLYGERHGWYLPGFPDKDWKQVTLPHAFPEAGIAWYRTTFDLDIPEDADASIGVRIEDANSSSRYRALIFLNEWMLGHYINYVGLQHFFALPTGILNPRGSNQLSIAVWGQEGGEGLWFVGLETYAVHRGGVPVEMVYSPDYKELFG